MSTKVLLVDNHAIVRLKLYSLMKKHPDIEVVGGVEDGQQAVDAVQALTPDIVVKNANTQNPKSLNAPLKDKLKKVKVITLSINSSQQAIAKMLKGAIQTAALQ